MGLVAFNTEYLKYLPMENRPSNTLLIHPTVARLSGNVPSK